jgi:hypothetical protein
MALKRGIVAFYENKAADTKGRRLDEILEWPASELEHCHNYIQILFPLPERSAFNDPAPIIDKEVFEAFRSRKDLRDRLRESFQRILWFYGFQLHKDNDGKLEVSNRSSISKSELVVAHNLGSARARIRCALPQLEYNLQPQPPPVDTNYSVASRFGPRGGSACVLYGDLSNPQGWYQVADVLGKSSNTAIEHCTPCRR